ncbi:hypothetical protein [Candidatus Nesciobacter abundans]|uniref:Uncharacterized protein n=1 Tax=Candidatus Nesciobacter abundans TaxID=2601668 RepID=A0A5C0UJF0_9PROT|nr:hypothetical protein [Candidatus Nesciobacter abundans]QEK38934.1 hypothetical protein FZC36_00580 [Candidatus Nesciobacter abundans]
MNVKKYITLLALCNMINAMPGEIHSMESGDLSSSEKYETMTAVSVSSTGTMMSSAHININAWLDKIETEKDKHICMEIAQIAKCKLQNMHCKLTMTRQLLETQQQAVLNLSDMNRDLRSSNKALNDTVSESLKKERESYAELSKEKDKRFNEKEISNQELLSEKEKLAFAIKELADKRARLECSGVAIEKAESSLEKLEKNLNSKELELESVKSEKQEAVLSLVKESTSKECNEKHNTERILHLNKLLEEAKCTIKNLQEDSEKSHNKSLSQAMEISSLKEVVQNLKSAESSKDTEIEKLREKVNALESKLENALEFKVENAKLESEIKNSDRSMRRKDEDLNGALDQLSFYRAILKEASRPDAALVGDKVASIFKESSCSVKKELATEFIDAFDLKLDTKDKESAWNKLLSIMIISIKLNEAMGNNIVGKQLYLKEVLNANTGITFIANKKPDQRLHIKNFI